MKQNSSRGRGVRILKSYIYSVVIFALLIAGCGLLIRFTPLPERWSAYYVLVALCISCFFLGIFIGSVLQKRGIVFGALYSVLLIITILLIRTMITESLFTDGLFQIRFLLCVICGSIGGMMGVNLRS